MEPESRFLSGRQAPLRQFANLSPPQVQKLKVDTEAAMLQCDQILRANELSIALVAAIPAFLVAGVAVLGVFRWLSPTPPDPRWEAMGCRCDIASLVPFFSA